MQRFELEVSVREAKGKGAARQLRARGTVPGVLYGSGVDTLSVSVEGQKLERVLRGGMNALIDLKGEKPIAGKLALVKDVQRDPISQRLLHCDLYSVDTKKKISVAVPIHIEGRAPGVEAGGILNLVSHDLEVSCLPLAIPDRITVDISKLNIGDMVRLGEIALPEGAEPVAEASQALVTVSAPKVEEEPAEAEAEAAEGAEEAAPAAEGAEEKPAGGERKEEGGGE